MAAIVAVSLSATALPVYGGGHFSWGVDAGSTVDVSGHEMSSVNLDAMLGYSGPYLDFAGAGAGIQIMVSNSSRVYPVYGILRSSFRKQPGLIFFEARVGVAFDSMTSGPTRKRCWANPALGIYLARGKRFSSWLTAGYMYNDIKWYGVAPDNITYIHGGLSGINVRIGINF